MALPRSCPANDALMMARLPGTSSAPPAPCTARATISSWMLDARPHHSEAAVNSTTPMENTRLRPKRSPAAPPTSSSAPRKSAKDSTTHCASDTVAPKSACKAGSAMLTTVPSMKTMLDARIVAARIHGPTCGGHETAAGALNTTASSHGGFVLTLIDLEQKVSLVHLPFTHPLSLCRRRKSDVRRDSIDRA